MKYLHNELSIISADRAQIAKMRGQKRSNDERHGIRLPGTLLDEMKKDTTSEWSVFFSLNE